MKFNWRTQLLEEWNETSGYHRCLNHMCISLLPPGNLKHRRPLQPRNPQPRRMTSPNPLPRASAARCDLLKDLSSALPRPCLKRSIHSFLRPASSMKPRSFGEQVKHVACAQFAFFNEFEGRQPPDDCEKGGHDPAKTKTELVKYLYNLFDYSNRILATLTANNALDRVEGRSVGGPRQKLGTRLIAVLAHHRPLWTAGRISSNERYRSTNDAEVRAQGPVTHSEQGVDQVR